jgi:hypothetical protein
MVDETNLPPHPAHRPRDQNSFTRQFHQHSSLTTEFAAPHAGCILLVSWTLLPEETNASGQRTAEHKPRSRQFAKTLPFAVDQGPSNTGATIADKASMRYPRSCDWSRKWPEGRWNSQEPRNRSMQEEMKAGYTVQSS